MPITQKRMLDLLAAGSEYKLAFEAISIRLTELVIDHDSGRLPTNKLYDTLLHLGEYMRPKPAHGEVLVEEKAHFKAVAGRNDMARRRMQRRRGTIVGDDGLYARPASKAQVLSDLREQSRQATASRTAASPNGQDEMPTFTDLPQAAQDQILRELELEGFGAPVAAPKQAEGLLADLSPTQPAPAAGADISRYVLKDRIIEIPKDPALATAEGLAEGDLF